MLYGRHHFLLFAAAMTVCLTWIGEYGAEMGCVSGFGGQFGLPVEGRLRARQRMCRGGKGPMVSQMVRQMLPSEAASEHFRTTGIEFLRGFRELIDHRIETLSKEQGQSKGTKLNVEQ